MDFLIYLADQGYSFKTNKKNLVLARLQRFKQNSPGRIWTYDKPVNSRPLYPWATEDIFFSYIITVAYRFCLDKIKAGDTAVVDVGEDNKVKVLLGEKFEVLQES